MSTTISLTKFGAMIRVEVFGDPIGNDRTYYIAKNDAKPIFKKGTPTNEEQVTILIGNDAFTLDSITSLTIAGTDCTDFDDFEARINEVFPEEGSGSTTLAYDRYVAKISQTGTNAPTEVSVYENTLGAHEWERYDEGIYVVTFTEKEFVKSQTWLFISYLPDADPATVENTVGIEWGPYPNSIRINTVGDSGFDDAPIEIRVYPAE